MGYVNNTHMSLFIPPASIQKTAGSWTPGVVSNIASDVRSAADASFTLIIPLPLPGNSQARAGARLMGVDLYYKIAAAAADDFATVELEKMTLPASGSALAGMAVATTCDAGHDIAAERKAIGDHTLTVTLNTPAYLDDGDAYVLVCTLDAASATVFSLFGARANYELRL